MLIVDAHQDLAWNMLAFGRDYTRPKAETRRLEAGGPAPALNGDTLLGWPEYQRGRVALVFASLFATPLRLRSGDWKQMCFTDPVQARRLYQAQIDAYERLGDDHPDKFQPLKDRSELEKLLAEWRRFIEQPAAPDDRELHNGSPAGPPAGPAIGLVYSMEGADCIRDPGELEEWWGRGVRIIGPAWGGNQFCGGTHEPGPLTSKGFALLERMADLGFGLDLTHMDEQAVLQALEVYPGTLLASHSNAQALLRDSAGNRHLSDRVIDGIFEREGVIGVVPFNQFLKPGWRIGDPRQEVGLERVVAQIDYFCQRAGDARHVGLGTDFDGGFGVQSVPVGIDSIADLPRLAPLLAERGYAPDEIAAVLGENWISLLKRILP
jgi:membrane dipeptidase